MNSDSVESQTGTNNKDEVPFKCDRDCGNIIEYRESARFKIGDEWCCAVCAREEVPDEFNDRFGEYVQLMEEARENNDLAIKYEAEQGISGSLFRWSDGEWHRIRRLSDGDDYYWTGEWTKENNVLDALARAKYQDKDYEWDWASPPRVVDIQSEKDTEGIRNAC